MPDAIETVAAREAERTLHAAEQSELDPRFLAGVDDVVASIAELGIDVVFVGGIASMVLGRPRLTQDIDVFVRPPDARPLLTALARHGYDVEERAPHWLYKATREGQLIDVIFRASGDVYLDDEMVARATHGDLGGRSIPLLSIEDMVVMKALSHEEHSPRHWFDALALLAAGAAGDGIDWAYLERRAAHGPRRVCSLLLYARSVDVPVPAAVCRSLFEAAEP